METDEHERKWPWHETGDLVIKVLGLAVVLFGAPWATRNVMRYQTMAGYLQIIANPSSPDFAKELALSSLLSFDYVDVDSLLDAAFNIENSSRQGSMTHLIYAFADSGKEAQSPVGVVDTPSLVGTTTLDGEKEPALICRPVKTDPQVYVISGWAIDRKRIQRILLYVDGNVEQLIDTRLSQPAARDHEYGIARPDIAQVFRNYPRDVALYSGFSFKLRREQFESKCPLVAVKIENSEYRFRIIFNRVVAFSQ